jgi:hypothetical protein
MVVAMVVFRTVGYCEVHISRQAAEDVELDGVFKHKKVSTAPSIDSKNTVQGVC